MLLQEGGGVEGGNRRDSRGMMEVLGALLRREASVGGDIRMGVLGVGGKERKILRTKERLGTDELMIIHESDDFQTVRARPSLQSEQHILHLSSYNLFFRLSCKNATNGLFHTLETC